MDIHPKSVVEVGVFGYEEEKEQSTDLGIFCWKPCTMIDRVQYAHENAQVGHQ
jgi:hypothetical protein